MRKAALLRVLGLAVVLSFASSAAAQVPTGSIAGTVLDPAGLAVSGADITLTNEGTGVVVFRGRTSDQGAYLIPALPFGTYRLEVKMSGFKTSAVSGIKVDAAAQTSVAPVQLELGDVGETITVEAGIAGVQTTHAQITDTVEKRQIESLPLLNRNPLALLGLQAGVNQNARTTTVISGQRTSFSNLTLDGVNIQDNFIRSNALDFSPNLPLLSQVAEFTIGQATAGSESGLGATQVSLVTPAGTNEWHGETFWYHRNNIMRANTWFNNARGIARPKLIQNQLGGNLGGPVWKDKVFVYGYYEAFRLRQQSSQNHTVLTQTARQGLFTFVPTCTTNCPPGVTPGQPQTFNVLAARTDRTLNPNNIVGPFVIDPYVAGLLSQVPTDINNFDVGDSTAALLRNTAGLAFNKRNDRTRDNYGFRGDWIISQNHSVYSTWAWNRDIVDRPDLDGSFTTSPVVKNDDAKKLLSGTWRWTIGPALTNEFRGGFNLAPATFINSTQFASGEPLFGGFNFTNPVVTFRNQGRDTNTYNLSDNLGWAKGNQFMRFGWQSQWVRTTPFNDAGINPTYNIGLSTANPNALAAGHFTSLGGISSADLTRVNALFASLTGQITTASQTFNPTSPTSGFVPGATSKRRLALDTHSIYFTNNWRMHRKFTFNYGLRWDYYAPLDNLDGLFLAPIVPPGSDIITTIRGNPTLDAVGGPTGRRLWNRDLNNFAPSIGFAWDPWGDGKSAVRAGYSVHFVNDEGIRAADNALLTNPGLQTTRQLTLLNTTISAGLPVIATPTFQVPRTLQDNFNLSGIPTNLGAVNPNLRTAYVQDWTLSLQREVGWNTLVELRYVGNKGTKLTRSIDYNQVIIFQNGFFDDFMRARANGFLALSTPANAPGCGTGSAACGVFNPNYNPNLPGSQPLTIFPLLPGGGFLNDTATVRPRIQQGQVGDLAAVYHSNNLFGPIQFAPNILALPTNVLGNVSNSTYHAGIVEVRRRFSRGLSLQANYTFSKGLSDFSGEGQTNFQTFLDNANPRLDKSRVTYDITHAFKANFVYELPFGRGQMWAPGNAVLNKVVSGWNVSSIFTWQSGNPFSIISGRGTLNRQARCGVDYNMCTAESNLTVDEIRNLLGIRKQPGRVYYINPSVINPSGSLAGTAVGEEQLVCNYSSFSGQAFCNQTPGKARGNTPLLGFNGPTLFAWDFGLIKRTPITEGVNFEYRAEFFNILNHPVFFVGDQNINSTTFGQSTSVAVGSRVIQMTVRVIF